MKFEANSGGRIYYIQYTHVCTAVQVYDRIGVSEYNCV